jgi:hypothetical protein
MVMGMTRRVMTMVRPGVVPSLTRVLLSSSDSLHISFLGAPSSPLIPSPKIQIRSLIELEETREKAEEQGYLRLSEHNGKRVWGDKRV